MRLQPELAYRDHNSAAIYIKIVWPFFLKLALIFDLFFITCQILLKPTASS